VDGKPMIASVNDPATTMRRRLDEFQKSTSILKLSRAIADSGKTHLVFHAAPFIHFE
jgi:hypothetical protein